MTPAQRLVNRIREFVNGFNQEPTPAVHEMAQQYAEICRSLNDRLAKSAEFLQKGMRSEAVQEATEPPSVFSLADTLHFAELKKWRNLCLDLGMTPPPEIDTATTERLQEECSTEQFLTPLLREFRRLVHKGTTAERIRILRQIKALDAENEVWRENLEPLEREQMEKLIKLAEESLAANNLAALREAYDEMTEPDWLLTPPQDVVTRIEHTLAEQRRAEARKEGTRLADELQAVLAAKDFDRAGPLVEKWKRLMKYQDFQPQDDLLQQVAPCVEWFTKEKQRRVEEAAFNEVVELGRKRLRHGESRLEWLEDYRNEIESFARPIPEDLKAELDARTAQAVRKQVQKRRFRRLVSGGIVVALIVTVLCILAVVVKRNEQKRVHETITALWQQERYVELADYLQSLSKRNPDLYRQPGIQTYVAKVENVIEEEGARRQRLQEIMTRLQDIRAAGFAGSEVLIESLLTEGHQLVTKPGEEGALEAWEREWSAWQVHEQNRLAGDIRQRLAEITQKLAAVAVADADRGGEAARQLEEAGHLLAAGTPLLANAPEELRQQWESLTAEYRDRVTALAEQRRQAEQARQLRRRQLEDLPRQAAVLSALEDVLQQHLAAFPDAPEAAGLRASLAALPVWRDALAGNDIALSGLPLTAQDTAAVQSVIDGLPAGHDSIWYRDLEACRNYGVHHREALEKISDLRFLPFFDVKSIRVRRKGDDQWRTLFYSGTFYVRQEAGAGGEAFTRYWGDVFVSDPQIYEPRKERVIYDSLNWEVEMAPRDELNLIPAARFAREIIAAAPRQSRLDVFLLENARLLVQRQDIEVLPKAALLKEIIAVVRSISSLADPYTTEAAELLGEVRADASWVNTAHARVQQQRALAEQQLARFPDMNLAIQALEYNSWLLIASLNRQIGIAGAVTYDLAAEKAVPYVTVADAREIWLIMPGSTGTSTTAKQVYTGSELDVGRLPTADRADVSFLPGQVLFFTRGQTSAQILDSAPVSPPPAGVQWPASWPAALGR